MRKHLGVGWGYWSTMTQNGTRMHKLRPLKPKSLRGRTPRPPFNNIYSLGVILQTFMPHVSSMLHVFQDETHFDPEYLLHYANNYFGRVYIHKNCGVHSPMKSPNVTYFRQSDLKNTKNDLKLGKSDLKYHDLKLDFPLGGLVMTNHEMTSSDSER